MRAHMRDLVGLLSCRERPFNEAGGDQGNITNLKLVYAREDSEERCEGIQPCVHPCSHTKGNNA